MPEPTACLQDYTEGIRALLGAGCVTLFVPAASGHRSQEMLHHCGPLDPVPELLDLEQARSFCDRRSGATASTDPNALRVLRSSDEDSGLIALPAIAVFGRPGWAEGAGAGRRRSDTEATGAQTGAWLGIRLFPGDGSVSERLLGSRWSVSGVNGDGAERLWNWLFFLGSALATHSAQVAALLRDPLTGLADRRQFQSVLTGLLEAMRADSSSLALVFINPDDFGSVNERFGREVGDRCVTEISERLRSILRSSDLIARYGGVIFVAILGGTPSDTADTVAQRLCANLTNYGFADGEVHLNFSIGYSHTEFSAGGETIEAMELIRQADLALSAAKRSPGSWVQRWREDSVIEEAGSFDRLAGIFTGNMSKDYRNMELLRDIADLIALHAELPVLAHEVVESLFLRLAPRRIGLFSSAEGRELQLLWGLTRSRTRAGTRGREQRLDLNAARNRLLSAALDQGEPQHQDFPVADSHPDTIAGKACCYAIPLIAGEDSVGCLYLEGLGDSLLLDDSDLLFFKALASQVAVALDRARLAELESERRRAREEALRAELHELRHALSRAQLVYRSPEMTKLVATAQRAAATDATVLITGATGTGKELLARTIHELSPRGDQPFVVVDCGAIPDNLIESELFGHEKGAFTGAEARRPGRLEAAGKGTVLLDEIGELPLEVQSRLLRFVQEKEFTRVGGSQVQHTGIRILAATNRDLAAEIQAGRFRADLYHRLRVIVLTLPPLRKRRQDILFLAQHFLQAFRVQYQKKSLRLSDESEQWLLAHDWPGNVRELKHRILQSVVLAEGSVLTPADLGDAPDTDSETSLQPDRGAKIEIPSPASLSGRQALWHDLRDAAREVLDTAVVRGTSLEEPLASWFCDEVLLRADDLVDGVGRQTAILLGVSDSSCRRWLIDAKRRRSGPPPSLTVEWQRVEQAIDLLLTGPNREANLWRTFEDCFLSAVLERFPNDTRTAAALLGVDRRTFRKRAAKLVEAGPGASETAAGLPLAKSVPWSLS